MLGYVSLDPTKHTLSKKLACDTIVSIVPVEYVELLRLYHIVQLLLHAKLC